MPHHISGEILQLIVRLSREGHREVDTPRITVVTQGAFTMILERVGQTGCPTQRPFGHYHKISHPVKTNIFPEVKSPWTSPVSEYHHPASSCCEISFSQDGTMPYTVFSVSSAPPAVCKTWSCWGYPPRAKLYLH